MKDVPSNSQVWMSHGDTIKQIPENYEIIASTADVKVAAYKIGGEQTWGIQFHPEVYHSTDGKTLLKNFVVGICGCSQSWTPDSFVETTIKELREKIGSDKVVLGLSGGVDSRTASQERILVGARIVPRNGLECYRRRCKAGLLPRTCRRNRTRTQAHDVIESAGVLGPAATIKSHHNVGGLPEKMNLKIVEPLRLLFKDEVRRVGKALNVSNNILGRHPFPGPGLAIRIIGDITAQKVEILQNVDDIFIQGLREDGLYDQIWQAGAILLPVQSVGVMGDERTYENVVALRAVHSTDGMTADWVHLPYEFLAKISNKIINKVKGVNRVVYDISSKPPATIEWESKTYHTQPRSKSWKRFLPTWKATNSTSTP